MGKKPTRQDLLETIHRLQGFINEGLNKVPFQDPQRVRKARIALDVAYSLCVEAQAFDKPIAGCREVML